MEALFIYNDSICVTSNNRVCCIYLGLCESSRARALYNAGLRARASSVVQ